MKQEKRRKCQDGAELQTYLRSLPVSQYATMMKTLIDACKVPAYTFKNWRYGICRIPDLAKYKIEEVAGEIIFSRYDD